MIAQQQPKPFRDTKIFQIISQSGQTEMTRRHLTDMHCDRNEMAVIGAAVQNKVALHTASNMLTHADFSNLQRGAVWYCIQQVADRGEAVDILSITNEARTNPLVTTRLSADDVPALLSQCIMSCPNADNVHVYATHVIEFATRWRLASQLTGNIVDLASGKVNLPDIMDRISSSILQASKNLYTPQTSAHATMTQYFDRLTHMYEFGLDPSILTGFVELDQKTGGLFPGNVTVLVGESGRGKTTMGLSTTHHFVKTGYQVEYFTLEMSQEEIIRILTAMETGISRTALKKGTLTSLEYSKFVKVAGEMSKWTLDIIDDLPSMTPAQMMRRLRMTALEKQVDVVILDGLWLMEASQPTGNRPEDVGQIMRELTWYAKELDIPILLLHQYKNMIGNRKPDLSDISESSKVQKTGQTVWGLYHMDNDMGVRETFIDVLKDRNGGSTGETIRFFYNRDYSRYEGGGVQHVSENNVPD